jgi:methanogenic corrinoid protein MtbC1
MPDLLNQMQSDLYNGDIAAIETGIRKALDMRMSPKEILDDGLIAGMNIFLGQILGHNPSYGQLPFGTLLTGLF